MKPLREEINRPVTFTWLVARQLPGNVWVHIYTQLTEALRMDEITANITEEYITEEHD